MEEGAQLPENVYLLTPTDQVVELQTILMDRGTGHSDFVFYADRLMRLLIEEGLNKLPFSKVTVRTPSNYPYEGIAFSRGNCGVSISRSGEAMEHALRQCCRSIRIGKMLLAEDTRLLYARLMPDIAQRRVLLLYPLISTGRTAIKAVSVLVENHVLEENIYLVTLFSTPRSIKRIMNAFPSMAILTSEINISVPYHFATKYFGTD